jgi:hypothetical protein
MDLNEGVMGIKENFVSQGKTKKTKQKRISEKKKKVRKKKFCGC